MMLPVMLFFHQGGFSQGSPIDAVKKGAVFNVPGWKWVEVENPKEDGVMYGIEFGGKVTVIGEFDSNTVLCRYKSPRVETYGTQCPSGVIFLMDKKELSMYNQAYKNVIKNISEKDIKIRKLLNEE